MPAAASSGTGAGVEQGLASDSQFVRALCEWSSLKPTAIARRAGLTPTTITRPFNGTAETRLSQPTMEKLRAAFPAFPGFQREPDLPASAPVQRDYVAVHVLPTYAGAGGGGTGDGDPETALIPRSLVEGEFRGRAADFELIRVRGDSMEPIFHHGDELLIDKRDRNPVQPGPFAIFDGHHYHVKLVERVAARKGFYRVFSANLRYSDDVLEESETTIMGRPVWFGRRL